MRLYLLRHEERTLTDISFFVPLTQRGKTNAKTKQVMELNKLSLTRIYSSPFLRALETIEPYINQKSLSSVDNVVNIDNSLAEASIFGYYKIYDPPLEWYKRFKINKNYKSITEKITKQETEEEIALRVRRFFHYLMTRYRNTNENILIVSHAYIIQLFLREMNLPIRDVKMGELIKAF